MNDRKFVQEFGRLHGLSSEDTEAFWQWVWVSRAKSFCLGGWVVSLAWVVVEALR